MKIKILSLLAFLALSLFAQAQTDTSIVVNGICEMCQETIETACDLDGVEKAEWSPETKILQLSYDADVISLEEINEAINNVGYDTEFTAASDEAYESIHTCCKYRDPEVQKAHE